MDQLRLRFGIPDMELECASGGRIRPATFVGHKLVVLFLPADRQAADRELDDYARLASDFSYCDAWFLAIANEAAPATRRAGAPHPLALDPDGAAWKAFRGLARTKGAYRRDDGAVFLFARGGSLQRSWPGPRHAADVASAIETADCW